MEEKEIREILKKLNEKERFTIAHYIAEKVKEIKRLELENQKLKCDRELLCELLFRECSINLNRKINRNIEMEEESYDNIVDYLLPKKESNK